MKVTMRGGKGTKKGVPVTGGLKKSKNTKYAGAMSPGAKKGSKKSY